MIHAINAGFGSPLSAEDLDLIRSLPQCSGVRQDVPTVETAPSLVSNILGAHLVGDFVIPVADPDDCHEIAHAVSVRAVELGLAAQCILEPGNEEDLEGKRWARDPRGWAALVADVACIAEQHSPLLRVVSGGVSSVSRRAMAWLQSSGVTRLETIGAPFGIGYHQYRSTPPDKPLEGYVSREEEFTVLRAVTGDRPLWMTECGWHTAPRESGCWPFRRRWRYDDLQVEQFLREEMRLNEAAGAECFVVYQLNDGLDPRNDQDRFGIRRTDGTLKPSAQVLA